MIAQFYYPENKWLTLAFWVDPVNRIEFREDSVQKLGLRHHHSSLNNIFEVHLLWHAWGRHYWQSSLSCVNCKRYPFNCQFTPQLLISSVFILQMYTSSLLDTRHNSLCKKCLQLLWHVYITSYITRIFNSHRIYGYHFAPILDVQLQNCHDFYKPSVWYLIHHGHGLQLISFAV